jgi:hypothetical protein
LTCRATSCASGTIYQPSRARRDFAERLLDAPADERHEVKPKTSGKDEERTGPFYCKTSMDSAASVEDLRKLNELLRKGHIEINKVEYLQLQEAAQQR